MTSRGTLDLNFLTLRRLFPYRNGTTDICANTILQQTPDGEVKWVDPVDVFGDVSGTLVAKGTCDSDYLYWNQTSQLWLPGGKRIRMGCDAGVIQTDLSAVTVAIGYNAGYTSQASTSIAIGQYAGNSMQGLGGVAIGSYAGSVGQRADGVAIGTDAGRTIQGAGSIAIGGSAGGVRQDASAVAIGFNAGLNTQGRGAVAMGAYAGFMDQSGSAVAIGMYAGSNKQGINTVAVGAGAGLLCQTYNAVAVGKSAGSGNQGANAIAIGESAGTTSQGQGAIALGSLAGSSTQLVNAIAIGSNAGRITQGVGSVAIGALAGSNVQLEGAIAIGFNAGYDRQNLNAVAIGLGAGYSTQNSGAIAIGSNAGYSTQGAGAVAIGMAAGFSSQGANAVAIGSNAGFGLQKVGAVAIGSGAGYSTQGAGAVAIGSNAGYSTQGVGAVALGMTAGWSSQGINAIAIGSNAGVSTQGTHAIAMGFNAGAVDQSANAVAIGLSAGFSSQGTSAVAIGWRAGSNVQGIGAIAVGEGAGLIRQGTNAVAIGLGAGLSTQNANAIAIGSNAGYSTQGASAIAFGQAAGISSQGTNAIAIGSNAGAIVQGIGAIAVGARAGQINQNTYAIAIGSNAGATDQSGNAVAIGFGAGSSIQDIHAIAIGSNAGYTSQRRYAVAIGAGAGATDQSENAIAIGSNAGATNQGLGAIAIGAMPTAHIQRAGAISIGSNANSAAQGANAIAIGNNVCGVNTQGVNAIAIGNNAISGGQDDNTIVLNATGSAINITQSSALYIAPIRNTSDDAATTTYVVQYDTGIKEVVYNSAITINSGAGIINVSGDILPKKDITYSLGSDALAFKHLYVSSIISDGSNVAISGDIIPYADNVYSVGLSTMRWKDVFVGPGSIYIGGSTVATRAVLEASDNSLIINKRNEGNVGIGVANPTARLDVSGTSRFTGTMSLSGDIVPNVTVSYDLGTNTRRWRNIYADTVFVTSGISLTGNLVPSDDDTYSLGINTTRWKDLYVGTGAVYIGGTGSATRAELTSATNNLIINATNGGSVGIGTANPLTKTHIYNTAPYASRSTNPLISVSGTPQLTLGADSARLYFGIYQTGGSTAATIQSSVFSSTDTGRDILLNPIGGFVGIGTANPIVELDVSGSVNAKDMYIRADATGTQNALYYFVGSTAVFSLYRPANTSDLRFYNYSGTFDMMALKSNGNVGIGIGNTNPATTLDVSGTGITVTSSGPVISIASTTNPGDMLVRNYGTSDRYGIGQYINGNMRLFASGTVNYAKIHLSKPTNALQTGAGATFTDVMTVDVFNSRVGIGTINPGKPLDVAGDIRAQGAVYGEFNAVFDPQIIARGTGANTNRFAYMGYNTVNNFGYIGAIESGIAQRDLHIQKDGGNVRIGSTVAPAYTLDVAGTINTNSAYYQNGYNLLPQGIILMWNGASTPTGWFICDGTNGTPDLRGRFVLASGQGTGLTNRTRGDVSGEETHTLTIPEMPAHTHGIDYGNNDGSGIGDDATGYTNTQQTLSTGGGLPHNNMPPFYVLVFIMKGF